MLGSGPQGHWMPSGGEGGGGEDRQAVLGDPAWAGARAGFRTCSRGCWACWAQPRAFWKHGASSS